MKTSNILFIISIVLYFIAIIIGMLIGNKNLFGAGFDSIGALYGFLIGGIPADILLIIGIIFRIKKR